MTTYFYDRVRGETVRSERKHAVYLPVHLPDNHWSIVVATPESEVLGTIHGFRNRLFLIVGIMLLTSAFCSYYLGRAFMIVKEEAKRKRMGMPSRRVKQNTGGWSSLHGKASGRAMPRAIRPLSIRE
ncbi:MAG: hypothetical protein ABSG91_08565 [Syntrophobacteraceae bacterium]|jgi:hypothetical protein